MIYSWYQFTATAEPHLKKKCCLTSQIFQETSPKQEAVIRTDCPSCQACPQSS